MKDRVQHTLEEAFSYQGIGLHSGKSVTLRFLPGEENTGLVFIRTDLPNQPMVKALADRVTSAVRATTLTEGDAQVITVEHILAALTLSGIDNCRIEMNSIEPPAGDGSAKIFCDLISNVGRKAQQAPLKWLSLSESYQVYDGERYIAILPYDGYRISFLSQNDHPELGTQYLDIAIDSHTKGQEEIASARTIGFIHELEFLKSQGLALGGSLDNALVYDREKSLNTPRYDNELVRHKILDVIGDLALCGGRIKGHVIAVQSAHLLNTQLATQLQAKVK